jgi:hypothetical protein
MHSAYAFGRGKAQLFNQQSEIEAVALSRLDCAAGGRVAESFCRAGEFLGSQRA